MHVQTLLLLLLLSSTLLAYQQSPTPWLCTDPNALDSQIEVARKLPACRAGYAIDIEDVVYQSTDDGTCSGKTHCNLHNKNTLTFACNHKQKCSVEIQHLRFHINATCGSTVRFFTKYRCVPVIFEERNYKCGALSRPSNLPDVKLFCENYYRLYIRMALVGVSVKQNDETTRYRSKCNKDTYWHCNHYVPDAYRNVCNNQLNYNLGGQCDLRYSDRPQLKGCPYGEASNFSLIEYSCIPGEGVTDDLPRVDICSNEISEYISVNRGLLHSPHYPHPLGKYLLCKKQLQVPRESRLRLFMLEKSMEYQHELNIRLVNNDPHITRTLAKNELFDTNITRSHQNEIVEIELKSNHIGAGNFLLYFQVDSRLSEYAPLVLEADRKADRSGKVLIKRDWRIVLGIAIGLVLVILLVLIVFLVFQISKWRRGRSLKYQFTNVDHQSAKSMQIEHPHLSSSSPPTIIPALPSATHHYHHRPNSATLPHRNDEPSDRESLLQQTSHVHASSTDTDSFYEEIKEHYQPAVDLDLGNNQDSNHYLIPKSFEDRKKFFDNSNSSQPIQDHRENEQRYRRPAPLATPERDKRRLANSICEAPKASTETLDVGANGTESEHIKRPKQPPPKIPPPRMDLEHPKPSAPPLHLLHNYESANENVGPHQRVRQLQQWNRNNSNA